jgi:hypothetical protein
LATRGAAEIAESQVTSHTGSLVTSSLVVRKFVWGGEIWLLGFWQYTILARLLARAGRVRYAVATGGNASGNSGSPFPPLARSSQQTADYPDSTMKAEGFGAGCTQKEGGKPDSPFELPDFSFCTRPDTINTGVEVRWAALPDFVLS